jgi:hypothetical protein
MEHTYICNLYLRLSCSCVKNLNTSTCFTPALQVRVSILVHEKHHCPWRMETENQWYKYEVLMFLFFRFEFTFFLQRNHCTRDITLSSEEPVGLIIRLLATINQVSFGLIRIISVMTR